MLKEIIIVEGMGMGAIISLKETITINTKITLIFIELTIGLLFITFSILNIIPNTEWIGWIFIGGSGTLSTILLIEDGWLKPDIKNRGA